MAALNPRILDWEGRRVWLVGASAGIGAALAVALAARGARLALSARSRVGLEAVAARLAQTGAQRAASDARGAAIDAAAAAPATTAAPIAATATRRLPAALLLPCDVTDGAAVEAAWNELLARWGGVDLVVYLAGTYTPLEAATPAAELLPVARQTLAINFGGALEVVSRVAPWLAAQSGGATSGGRPDAGAAASGHADAGALRGIVLVSSVAGYRGLPRALAYSASKAALIAYAESLYHDLAPRGIGVWVVNPGFVATRLTAQNTHAMPALIGVEEAAGEIVRGLARGGFEIHFPKRFSRLVKLAALLPQRLFFALMRRVAAQAPRQ